MKFQEERRWVVAGVAAIAIAMGAIFAFSFYRETQKYVASQGTGADAQQVASLKELAGAIKNPATRDEAIARLSSTEGAKAVDLLAALAYKSKEPEVRAAALTGLGQIADLRGLQVMTIGARDEDSKVRIAAVEALAKLGGDTALSAVSAALANDVNVAVRKAAALALAGTPGSGTTTDDLCNRLRMEETADVRAAIATAMGKLAEDKARQALVDVLANEVEGTVRLCALRSLGAIRDDYRIKGVACAIGDADADVRAEAKREFAQLGVEALPALVEALKSPQLLRVIKDSGGAAVHADILQVVTAMHAPETAETLFMLLDLAVEQNDEDKPRAVIRDGAAQALAVLGEAAVAPIARYVFKAGARWPLKRAAANVLTAVGQPAVSAIAAYAESHFALPSTEEAQLWVKTLQTIGGPDVAAAIEAVKRHDPAVVFAGLAASAPSAAEQVRPPAPQLEEYHLVLYGGIYGGNPPSAYAVRQSNLPFVKKGAVGATPEVRAYVPSGRRNVALDLARTARGWERALAHNLSHNNGISFGEVTAADIGDTAMTLGLKLAVGRDPYLYGGYGEYTLELKKTAENRYEGTYKGRYFDYPIAGTAVCTKAPPRRPLRAGFRPVEPNEHPRLLFRKFDLPALRAKLNTPLGKAAFRELLAAGYMDDGGGGQLTFRHVALGLLYQLTGDERYAQEAIVHMRNQMAERDFGFNSLGQVWGPRWSNIAEAYDLCYDAWPPAFRAEVLSYIHRGSFAGTTQMQKFSVCANNHPCSNYFSPICGGAAMLALTYWMDPGGPPAPPGGVHLAEPPALTGKPPAGVPVIPLVSGESPEEWIWSGPVFATTLADALLEALGDTQADPVRTGRTFSFGGENYSFGTIDSRYRSGGSVYPWPALAQDQPEYAGAGMVLATLIENHRPGFYQVILPAQGSSQLIVNGVDLPDRSYVRFGEGLYPLLLAYVGDNDMQAGIGVTFQFITAKQEEIANLMKEGAEQVKKEQTLFELAARDHKATGMDGELITIFYSSMVNMFRSHRILMGDGGFQSEGEGYTHTADTPLRFAAACWNVFGQTITPYPDVAYFPVRYIAAGALFPREPGKDGRPRPPSLVAQSFLGGSGGTHGVTFTSIGFPIIPDAYKPGVLWVWNKIKGVEEGKPETLANLVAGGDTEDVIHTFVNYPLDMKPVHPRECIPLTWRAKTKGLYIFRNAWEDQNDIILQAYANELITSGNAGPDAGGLRLMGLGHTWTYEGEGKKAGDTGNNIPLILEDGSFVGSSRGMGQVVAWNARDDGSGAVSINMDQIYSPQRGVGRDRGGILPLEPLATGPITGLRALAVDYTGKSGASALIALVDKIEGGGERHWVWPLPNSRGADVNVETGPNSFTIHQGDASLHATFVCPTKQTVEAPGTLALMPTTIEIKKLEAKLKRSDRAAFVPETQEASFDIMATASAGESFFVIMTLQRGDPPAVKVVENSGLDAVVEVGGQRVRFDGKSVIIADRSN